MANVALDNAGQNLDVERGVATIAVAGTSVEIPTNLSRVLDAKFTEVGVATSGQTLALAEAITATSTGTSVGVAVGGTGLTVMTAAAGTATAAINFFYQFSGKS